MAPPTSSRTLIASERRAVDFSHAPVVFQERFSLYSTGMVGTSQRVTQSSATTVDRTPHARLFVNADEPTTVRMDFVIPVTAWGVISDKWTIAVSWRLSIYSSTDNRGP